MGKWKKLLFLVLLLEMSFLIMSPVSTVTAKLYGLRMKRVQNANSEGPLPDPETIKLLLEQAIQHDGILTPGLKVTGMYASKQNENWSDGYCLTFSRSSDGGYFGNSCYYLDGLDLHPGIERLNQYHFSYQSLEFQPQELIKFNTMYRLYENPQTDERFIRGAFVRGSWIGDYTLNVSSSPETDFHNMIQTMNNIFDQIPWNVNGNDGELLFTATTRAIQRYIDRGELTLPNEYELTNIHLEESWSGAEIMNCFNFDLHIDYPGQFCFFRDNATDLTTQQRLFNLTHFANPYRQNEVMEGLSNLGEASLGITYFDFDQRAYTRADFVEGDWLVQVSMPIMESEEETVAILSDIANRIIKILDDLPANLEMNLSNIPYAQTLDYGLKQQNMPDGYQISPLVRCNGWEYFPAQYIFQNNELTTN